MSRDPGIAVRFWWARLTRRQVPFNRRVLEPRFKPIHWVQAHGIPIGSSARDLERLASIGHAAMDLAELDRHDIIVGILPPGPTLAFAQMSLGAQHAGLSAMWLPADSSPEAVAKLGPTVLAGDPNDLIRLLERGRADGLAFGGVHTLLAVGEPLDPVRRQRLGQLAGGRHGEAAVVVMYSPPGVRALWSECRDGTEFHTWPRYEVIELVDPLSGSAVPHGHDGEVVWTPVGWHGTVALRLRTGLFAALEDRPCVACGRSGLRVRSLDTTPPFARVLDRHPAVERWQAELRTVDGSEELIVFASVRPDADLDAVLRQLDRQLSVTQFVVLDTAAVDARVAAFGDQQVVDIRR
jgi:hypothetical protein